MTEQIAPTKEALVEALRLASEALVDIELSRIPLSNIALKASRLARLLCRFDEEKIFRLEAGGFPTSPKGISSEIWQLAVRAGRTYKMQDTTKKKLETYAYVESIGVLEAKDETYKLCLKVSQDASSSGPPNPLMVGSTATFGWTQSGNAQERQSLREQIVENAKRLSERRALIYDFVAKVYHDLRFSQLVQDIFSTYRQIVDLNIGRLVPNAIMKFAAVHEGLRSSNPEDWSNSAHSCRRILQDLADAVFPPQKGSRFVKDGEKEVEVKLGPSCYINRLVCYAQDRSKSERYLDIVGSHLHYLGDRLDAVFQASQKGTHADVKKEEANRIALFTYMIVGDILALAEKEKD